MSIQERQNTEESIGRLASQRYLYSRAKFTRTCEMCLFLLVALLGLGSSAIENFALSQWIPLIVLFVWFADQFILRRIESAFKTEAAIIQEDFDCFVLDLAWPEHKGMERPTPDRLRQLARKAFRKSGGSAGLIDWYQPDEIPRDPIQSKMHCQKINCWWDANLRRNWKNLLYVALGFFVVLALILSLINNITVSRFVALVASAIGVFHWGIAEIIDQDKSGQKISGLHRHLSSLTLLEQISPSAVRSVQDEIFEHRRTCPPVPNWFYRINRDVQESEATAT